MGKIDRAIELVKASWGVLRNNKGLLILPVISGICALVVIASFAVPVVLITISANEGNTAAEGVNYPPAAMALAFLGYLTVTFVGMFFNSALIHAANERMDGGDPTLGSALSGASSRIGKIFQWALVASTVSLIIRQIQERMGVLGKVLGFLAGTAWAVVTFLVLPIVVIEGLGPVDAVQRSAALLKRSWGEGLAGHFGLGVINVLVFAFLLAIIALTAMVSQALLIGVLPMALFALLISIIVMSALSTVFQTALYRHASGLSVAGFDPRLMHDAFTHKKGKKNSRPSTPSEMRRQLEQENQIREYKQGGQAPQQSVLDGPQDWSKLPDEWS